MSNETQTNAPTPPTRYALVCVLCKFESAAYSIDELKTLMSEKDQAIADMPPIISDLTIRKALDFQMTKLGWDCRSKRGERSPYCNRCARFA